MLLLVPGVATADSFQIGFSFCYVGSRCTDCVETVRMVATVDTSSNQVVLSGRSADGSPVDEKLEGCRITSSSEWRCETGRAIIQASAGEASFALVQPIVVHWCNSNLQTCLFFANLN
jgi:hypothetical protein